MISFRPRIRAATAVRFRSITHLIVGRQLAFALLIAAAHAHPNHAGEPSDQGVRNWALDSFRDFAAGTFDDAGVNAYVAADGTLRLINQWDLNNDGYIDLLLPNSHGYNEIADFYVYWGKDRWNTGNRLSLPSNGGKTAAVADLNQDGWLDVVLVNRFNGTKSELDLWIYWGSREGFSPERRDSLPAQGAESAAIADLNGDGFPEIIVANSGLSYHVAYDAYGMSPVYWNRRGRFSASHRTDLPTLHAQDVTTADLDGDGRPEIIFAQQGNEEGEAGLRIYFNAEEGFDPGRGLDLPGERSSAIAAADLDGDGRIDLVLANAFRLKGREGGIYNIIGTTHLTSFVYWNGPDGFDPQRRTELPTVSPQDVATGDLDDDGWPDIVFAQSSGGASFVYWGSRDGFHPSRRLAIPGVQHNVVEIADLDGNGRLDVVLAVRKNPGTYDGEVSVFWGGSDGLRLDDPLTLPAASPGGVVIADLDRSGVKDLVVVNRGDGPDASESPAYIYPGGPDGFDPTRRTTLPTRGSDSYLPADLNADGHVDIFFPHRPPTIFWGAPEGHGPERTSTLSSNYAFSGRAADFNRDGYLDLVVSEWTPGEETTHVYYGGPNGFSTAHRQVFPIRGLRFHTVADLNQDGWLDVIFPNFIDAQVVVFWNSPLGFDSSNQTVLPTRSAVTVEVADLNRDGHLDLIVPNLFDKNPAPGKPRSFGGSPEGDTFIFWGSPDGPAPDRRTILPSVGSADVVAADLNNNGLLDLVLSSYHAGETRSHPSSIFWNSPDGFDPQRSTLIPTHSASGVLVADFNRDGWRDVFFANHAKDGSHRTDTWLYWGGEGGFSEQRRTSLPGLGPHFLSVVDIGHVRDRGDVYAYHSAPYSPGGPHQIARLTWEAETPFRTAVRFQVRSADSAERLQDARWTGPRGPGSYFTRSGEPMEQEAPTGRWFQLRAELISPDSANSPILHRVSLSYRN